MTILILLIFVSTAILLITGITKKTKALIIAGLLMLLVGAAISIGWYFWLEKVQI